MSSELTLESKTGLNQLSDDVQTMFLKKETLYQYTQLNVSNAFAGLFLAFYPVKVNGGSYIRFTFPANSAGNLTVKLYQQQEEVFSLYYSQDVVLTKGTNEIIINCKTKEDTYLAIDGTKWNLYVYDIAPASDKVVGFYRIAHSLYKDDSSFKKNVMFFSSKWNLPGTIEVTTSIVQLFDEMQQVQRTILDDMQLLKRGSTGIYLVGKDKAKFLYTTITEAAEVAEDGATILIYPGTYLESIRVFKKCLHFQGINKNACIIKDSSANKNTPPFDVIGGSISNLTIIEDHAAPTTEEEILKYKAYSIHADSNEMKGKTLRIENCIIKNRYYACLGLGTWENTTIEIIDCEMETEEVNPVEKNRSYGCVFYHSATTENNVLGQKVSLINNRIYSPEKMTLRNAKVTLGSVLLNEFIHNVIVSKVAGVSKDILHATNFDKNNILSNSSFGNNIAVLNSTQAQNNENDSIDVTVPETDQPSNPGENESLYDGGASELVQKIKVGWNLGNSLESSLGTVKVEKINTDQEAKTYETMWGNPVTTPELIQLLKDGGFNGIRVPVTWAHHIIDDETMQISPYWLDRVQEIVDYIISRDMICILNVHHDTRGFSETNPTIEGGMQWLTCTISEYDLTTKRFQLLWKQIAERFKEYGTNLIFESFNEISSKDVGFNVPPYETYEILNKLNQDFVTTIRNSSGFNETRVLCLSTYIAGLYNYSYFKVPKDTIANGLIVDLHRYFYQIDQKLETAMFDDILKMQDHISIPIIIGEMGTTDSSDLILVQRLLHATNYIQRAAAHNIHCFWWDNGYEYAIVDRKQIAWKYESIAKALIAGLTSEPINSNYILEITQNDINLFEDGIVGEMGDITTHTSSAITVKEFIPFEYGSVMQISVTGYAMRIVSYGMYDENYKLLERYYDYTGKDMVQLIAPKNCAFVKYTISNPWNGAMTLAQFGYRMVSDDAIRKLTPQIAVRLAYEGELR